MEKREMTKKIFGWLKENRLAVLYFVFAVLVEMIAVFSVEKNPFMARPFISLGVLVAITLLTLLIPNQRIRFIVYAVLLAVQAVLDLVFSVIYDMTGQYFDFGMLNLRNDAFGILESIPVNFITFYSGLFFCALFVVYGLRMTHERKAVKKYKHSAWFYSAISIVGIAVTGVSIAVYYPRNGLDKYDEMINGKAESAYSAYGMIGNLIGEFSGAIFKDTSTLSDENIESFIYSEENISIPTQYYGLASGKNVITVLAESLEWYAFLSADEAFDDYPNALPFTTEQMQELYPNLRQFYNESLVMRNFHSREKTDIAETISIMGSYPTEAYINYDYEDNTLPHTIPNLLEILREEHVSKKSFHNGFKTFYNRDKAHIAFGFEGMTDMFDMKDISDAWVKAGVEEKACFHNSMFADSGAGGGLRNLDTEMVYTARNLIAPKDISEKTDERVVGTEYLDYAKGESFYSYITTITMHGVYYARDNLKAEQARLEEALREAFEKGDYEIIKEKEDEPSPYCYMTDDQEILFQYMVTALNTDAAIGKLRADLESKGLADDTIIVLFGDHNAYYHALSDFVKDIDGYETERKFTDLYNVPLMIYDSDLSAELQKQGKERFVDKFTCTADIVPTVLDLLGIRYYSNLYYGNSVLSDKQSVLYSRAYDTFISDGIVARSVNNVLYRGDMVTDAQLSAYKSAGTALVEKIKYCDYIFRQDYFADEGNLAQFKENMLKINS